MTVPSIDGYAWWTASCSSRFWIWSAGHGPMHNIGADDVVPPINVPQLTRSLPMTDDSQLLGVAAVVLLSIPLVLPVSLGAAILLGLALLVLLYIAANDLLGPR